MEFQIRASGMSGSTQFVGVQFRDGGALWGAERS